MTLLERVQRAGGEPCPFGVGACDLDTLKGQVNEIVAVDELASLISENPDRARNELKSACRRAFQEPGWALVAKEQRERLVNDMLDAVFGFGPLESMLADESVTEIMVNGPSNVFFERDGKLYRSDQVFASEEQVRALIDRILGPLGRRIDEASPMVNARLPEGHRVHAVIPPLAVDGTALTIRKFARSVIKLDEMRESGSIDAAMQQLLVWAVRARKSIAVSGGTGSGKTTLLNALSCELPQQERIITIEDSAELRFLEHPHVVRLEARPRNAEGLGEVTIRDLVTNALRMRPDRIVVGECRGAEALDMLQAMNTGHDGSMTTLHANSTADVVPRLTTMVRYAVDLPVDVVEENVANAFDLVVQTSRSLDGSRFVSELAELSFDRSRRCCRCRPLFQRGVAEEQGRWIAEPSWLGEVVVRGVAQEEEVASWIAASSCAA